MMKTDSMSVTGMQCGGCSTKLSLALNKVVAVEDVQVSLASGQVTVRYPGHRPIRRTTHLAAAVGIHRH
jgi:copper chaperone CopZ